MALAGVTMAPLAIAEPPVPTGTLADSFFGVNDLNDGWIHVIMPRNPVNLLGAVQAFRPDAHADLVVDVETWYVGAVGEYPYRLPIGDAALYPQSSLAFSDGSTDLYSTMGQHATPSADGKRLTYRIPVSELQDAGATGGEVTVWHTLHYVPRAHGAMNSGGAPTRADHPGADVDACTARTTTAPWADCPESGGFYSKTKNDAFFRAFDGDAYALEGEDADGSTYGTNDALVGALDESSSGPIAEVGLKGQLDRLEWSFTVTRVNA